MGIRITHGRVSDIGKLGVEAGKGQGAVRNQALQLQADLAANETQSRFQTAKIAANTAIQKSVIDATNRRELEEFKSFMSAESERRQIAWEIEKTESNQRHDFDLNIQRKDLEEQMVLEGNQRKEAEKQVRVDALDKAKESGDIGDQEYNEAILSMQVGPEAAQSLFGGSSLEEMSSFSERGRARTTRKAAIEEAKPENIAKRVTSLKSEVEQAVIGLDTETREEAYKLLGSGGITESALKRMLVDIKETKAAKKASLNIEKVIEFGFAG